LGRVLPLQTAGYGETRRGAPALSTARLESSILMDAVRTSTLLDGDVVEEVAKLRQELDGEIVVHGSAQLVQTLIETASTNRTDDPPARPRGRKASSAKRPTRRRCGSLTRRPSVTES
jgi:hypothetical protein